MPVVVLSEMQHGQEADLFVLMTVKEELTTRDGKPYFKVGFRDHGREVSFPIWHDSPWATDCREPWQPGTFYKLRAVYRDTNYGPQLDLRKIREVSTADRSRRVLRRPCACRRPDSIRPGHVRRVAGDRPRADCR